MGARLARPRPAGDHNHSGPVQSPRPVSLAIPHVALELLQHLQGAFPDSLSLVDRLGTLERAQGALKVIHYLEALYEEQERS